MSARTITQANVLDIQRRPLPSKHYVYVIEVTWSDGSVLTIYRRYSLFFEFHTLLLDMFPEASGEAKGSTRTIPFLPGKKLFERTNTRKHAMQRKGAIQDYINSLLKLPAQISACSHVKAFFSINDDDINPPTQEQLAQRAPNMLDKAARLVTGAEEEAPGEEQAMNVSTPMVLDQYRVLANYKKSGRSEVDVKEGDIVEVVEKNTNGWWFVNIDDAQGWLPATYLEALDALEPEEKPVKSPQGINYVSVQEFKTKESDEVSFEKGVVVFVLETNLDGWWRVKYRDKEGWAPATCLRILPSGVTPAAAIAQAEAGRARAGTNMAKAHPPRSAADHTEDRPMTRTRDERGRLTASVVVADTIANRIAAGVPAAATAAPRPKISQPSPAPAPAAAAAIAEEAPSKPGRPAAARAATVAAKDAAPRPADRKLSLSDESKADKKPAASAAASPDKAAAGGDEYVLLQDFTSDDKTLRLRGGERVQLLERGDGGWAFVRTAAGAEGWAPEDFMEKAAANGKPSPAPAPAPAPASTKKITASPTPTPAPAPAPAPTPAKVSLPSPAPAPAPTPAPAAAHALVFGPAPRSPPSALGGNLTAGGLATMGNLGQALTGLGMQHVITRPTVFVERSDLAEALFTSVENEYFEIALELHRLGVRWSMYLWAQVLRLAWAAGRADVINELLVDYIRCRYDDFYVEFVGDDVALLFKILRSSADGDLFIRCAEVISLLWHLARVPVEGLPRNREQLDDKQPGLQIGRQYVNSQELSDVTFKVEGRPFFAHKIILVTASERFKQLLTGPFAESRQAEITLEDVKYDTFRLMIEFVYSGSTAFLEHKPWDVLLDLLIAADYFLLHSLLSRCEPLLSRTLTIANAMPIYRCALDHNAILLARSCEQFFAAHLLALAPEPSFRALLFDEESYLLMRLQELLSETIVERVRLVAALARAV
eukprot:m.175957 g.175957  ORF g.175957 m.175957 type:complete len:942 (-) comp15337_c7_seq2:46-2871(-)